MFEPLVFIQKLIRKYLISSNWNIDQYWFINNLIQEFQVTCETYVMTQIKAMMFKVLL